MSDDSGGRAAFQIARRAVDRGACERWLKDQGFGPNSPGREAAKEQWRTLAHLNNEIVRSVSFQSIFSSRKGSVSDSTLFPSTFWFGGMVDVENGRPFNGTFLDFVKLLRSRAKNVAEKGAGLVFEPTTCPTGKRTNIATKMMHALNLDCDGSGAWDTLLSACNHLGLSYVAYQSGGYTQAIPKWHLLLPLHQAFCTETSDSIAHWKTCYRTARTAFGAIGRLTGEGFDPTVETPSIPIFLTEKRKASDPERLVVYSTGAALDLETLCNLLPQDPTAPLSATPLSTIRTAKACRTNLLDNQKLEKIVKTICVPMSNILSSRRELYLALTGSLLYRGIAPEDVRTIVEEVSLRCPGDPMYTPSEVDSKHKEHVHGCETTIGKWERDESHTQIGTLSDRWPEIVKALDEAVPHPFSDLANKFFTEERCAINSLIPSPAGVKLDSNTLTRIPSAPKLDIKELRKLVSNMKSRKFKMSKEVDGDETDLEKGILLHRVLEGEKLVSLNDPDLSREKAITKVMWMLAFGLPLGTSPECAIKLVYLSLTKMLGQDSTAEDLRYLAETCFKQAISTRLETIRQKAIENRKKKETMRLKQPWSKLLRNNNNNL